MDQIVVELNGIRYLLVELLVTIENKKQLQNLCDKYNCIYQGIKEIKKEGFFSKGYLIIKVLVSEENVENFNKEKLP